MESIKFRSRRKQRTPVQDGALDKEREAGQDGQ